MSADPNEAALALEFDVFAKRAGLAIAADRVELVYAGFKEMRRMLELLRQPRTAANEPAGFLDMRSVNRGL